eukprot:XP_001706520.1 Hypothetical protein GL50803_6319 [Giardia lamblia ATCC 50803]
MQGTVANSMAVRSAGRKRVKGLAENDTLDQVHSLELAMQPSPLAKHRGKQLQTSGYGLRWPLRA